MRIIIFFVLFFASFLFAIEKGSISEFNTILKREGAINLNFIDNLNSSEMIVLRIQSDSTIVLLDKLQVKLYLLNYLSRSLKILSVENVIPGSKFLPKIFCIDDVGKIYVLSSNLQNEIYIFKRDGTFYKKIKNELINYSVAIAYGNKLIYLLIQKYYDVENPFVAVINESGELLKKTGKFDQLYPNIMSRLGERNFLSYSSYSNKLYQVITTSPSVHIFNTNGAYESSIKIIPPFFKKAVSDLPNERLSSPSEFKIFFKILRTGTYLTDIFAKNSKIITVQYALGKNKGLHIIRDSENIFIKSEYKLLDSDGKHFYFLEPAIVDTTFELLNPTIGVYKLNEK